MFVTVVVVVVLLLLLLLLLLFLWGPSPYASESTSALWLIVLSPYLTFQLSPPVPRCHAP
jgi:hypothetical protein